ncbi:MAG: YcxB family protein [Oscillospiraceae bacterium]|jgi:hypothetical protein
MEETKVYENRFNMTEVDLREIFLKIVWKSAIPRVIVGLGVISVLMNIVCIILKIGGSWKATAVGLLVIAFVIIRNLIQSRRLASAVFQQHRTSKISYPVVSTIGTEITLTEGYPGYPAKIPLNTIRKLYETKYFYIVITKSSHMIFWKKDGFVDASYKEFYKFLRPQIRL